MTFTTAEEPAEGRTEESASRLVTKNGFKEEAAGKSPLVTERRGHASGRRGEGGSTRQDTAGG